MSSTPSFPFGPLPGGNGTNPLLQGFEMMRQSWGQFAPGQLGTALNPPSMLDPSELDRRISELQAIENWLTLNLTMLQGSIRAMEVQRATLATLHSFANMSNAGFGTSGSPAGSAWPASPSSANEAPSPSAATAGAAAANPAAAQATNRPEDTAAAPRGLETFANPAQTAEAQQAWWNLLQQQFNQIASAAAATFPPAVATPDAKPTATNSESTPAPTARKTTARTSSSRKTASKTAATKSSTRRAP